MNTRLALAAVGAVMVASVVGALAYQLAWPTADLLFPAIVRGTAAQDARREIMLTFDDGPSEPFTAQVLDVLRASGIKATFFLCGANAELHPGLVRRIRDEGHAIGNHTYSHPYLTLMSRRGMAAEIDRTQDSLERLSGRRPTLFRPPFGVRWFTLAGVLAERGLRMVLWTIRPYDGRLDAPGIVKLTLEQLRPGAIIVLHDGFETHPADSVDRSATVRALPAIIAGARKAGYTFGRLADR